MLRYLFAFALRSEGPGKSPTTLLTSLPSHLCACEEARTPIGISTSLMGGARCADLAKPPLTYPARSSLKLDFFIIPGGAGDELSIPSHSATAPPSSDWREISSRHSLPLANDPLIMTTISSGLSPLRAETQSARTGGNSSQRPAVETSQKSISPEVPRSEASSRKIISVLQVSCCPLECTRSTSK